VKRFNTRLLIKKIVGLLLLTSLVAVNQACQSNPKHDAVIQDQKRIQHAQELLHNKYKKSPLKKFEGDFKLANYIERYIQQENPNLDAEELTETILKVSREKGYDPVFLLAVIKTESQFNPNTIGQAGEIGLMQIKPSTAEWICKKKNIKWRGSAMLKDPSYNVLVGAYYFHYLKKTLDSKSMRYINAYNMGINNLQRLPASAQSKHPYYGKIISNYLTIYSQLQKYREII
jgi:soluble lytic murein transglycosylase